MCFNKCRWYHHDTGCETDHCHRNFKPVSWMSSTTLGDTLPADWTSQQRKRNATSSQFHDSFPQQEREGEGSGGGGSWRQWVTRKSSLMLWWKWDLSDTFVERNFLIPLWWWRDVSDIMMGFVPWHFWCRSFRLTLVIKKGPFVWYLCETDLVCLTDIIVIKTFFFLTFLYWRRDFSDTIVTIPQSLPDSLMIKTRFVWHFDDKSRICLTLSCWRLDSHTPKGKHVLGVLATPNTVDHLNNYCIQGGTDSATSRWICVLDAMDEISPDVIL